MSKGQSWSVVGEEAAAHRVVDGVRREDAEERLLPAETERRFSPT